MSTEPGVFVSHSSADREFAERKLIPLLEGWGLDPWFADRSIVPADQWEDGIRAGLRDCEWFLVILSSESVKSRWVKTEVHWALELKPKRIVPVVIDGCDPGDCHLQLKLIQYVDWGAGEEAAREKLASVFGGLAARETAGSAEAATGPVFGQDAPEGGPHAEIVHELRRLRTNPDPSGVPFALGCLAHEDKNIRARARQVIQKLGWERTAEAIEEAARGGDAEEVGPILDGLASLEPEDRTVRMLSRLCELLKGELRHRAISVAEHKRLSLQLERVARVFEDHDRPLRIERVLGQGLFVESYGARHRHADLRVVVRVLRPELALQDSIRAQFVDLTNRATRYVHQRLAITRDVGHFPEHNLYYCVRDHVDGTVLQHVLDAGKTFEPLQAVEIVRQIASALDPIHRDREPHGGIKPTNVFVVGDHGVVLGDPSLPISSVPVGLPRLSYDYRYCAPESFDPVRRPAPAWDFYALGCVAYQLFCGRPPFVADNPFDLAQLHRTGDVAPPSALGASLGPTGDRLLLELLARDPAQRPSSVQTVLDSLEALKRELAEDHAVPPTLVTLIEDDTRRQAARDYSMIAFVDDLDVDRTVMFGPDERPAAEPTDPGVSRPGAEHPGAGVSDAGIGRSGNGSPAAPEATDPGVRPTTLGDAATPSAAGPGMTPPGTSADPTLWPAPPGATHTPVPVPSEAPASAPSPTSLADPLVGKRIRSYEVLGVLGRGGMGVVYKARHDALDRIVAIKVLNSSVAHQPELPQRFQREMRALARLQHPNIVTAYDAGEIDGAPFLVMELLQGIELGDLVHRDGPLPAALAAEVGRQAAEGLQHAHENGMVHRDVKPSNLMLTPSGAVKLLDLGVARLAHAPQELTAAGTVIGTPDYMSPEQFKGAGGADARSDVYSLGCTLYFALTGHPPYEADDVWQKLRAHLEQEVPSVRNSRPDIPEGLDAIVTRMLAKEPGDRFESARDVAEALAAFTRGADVSALFWGPAWG